MSSLYDFFALLNLRPCILQRNELLNYKDVDCLVYKHKELFKWDKHINCPSPKDGCGCEFTS